MGIEDKPTLAAFLSRRYARGGPPVTWVICQPLGGLVAHLSFRTGIPPNALTAASLVLGLGGCFAFAAADSPGTFVLAGMFLVLSYVFDCADGQLARAVGDSNYRGAWLDIVADSTIVMALALAVLYQSPQDEWEPWAFGASLLLGGGRTASLITTVLPRRDPHGTAWRSRGATRLARVAYISVIDTPVVYVLLVVAAATAVPLLFVAALLGSASFVHAIVIGGRIYTGASVGEAASQVP